MTTNSNDPRLRKIQEDGQQEIYLVLSEEERAKGYVHPVRYAYEHLACGSVTTTDEDIAETYARDPKFYVRTMCTSCGSHFNLRLRGGAPAFVWEEDGAPVGEERMSLLIGVLRALFRIRPSP